MRFIFMILLLMSGNLSAVRAHETLHLLPIDDITEINITSSTGWMLRISGNGKEILGFGAADFSLLPKNFFPLTEVYKKLKDGLIVQRVGEYESSVFFSMNDRKEACYTYVTAKKDRDYIQNLMQMALKNRIDGPFGTRLLELSKSRPFLPPTN